MSTTRSTLERIERTTTTITTEHVDLISSKSFEKTVKDLTAELGKASTEKLMDRLYGSDSWDAYAAECTDFAGRSNLIEVGYLNWGKVLTLSGKAMKARCYILGNPVTAQKLLAAGGVGRQNSLRTENGAIPCRDGCPIQVIPSPSSAENLSQEHPERYTWIYLDI
jgi:hypothetical protein